MLKIDKDGIFIALAVFIPGLKANPTLIGSDIGFYSIASALSEKINFNLTDNSKRFIYDCYTAFSNSDKGGNNKNINCIFAISSKTSEVLKLHIWNEDYELNHNNKDIVQDGNDLRTIFDLVEIDFSNVAINFYPDDFKHVFKYIEGKKASSKTPNFDRIFKSNEKAIESILSKENNLPTVGLANAFKELTETIEELTETFKEIPSNRIISHVSAIESNVHILEPFRRLSNYNIDFEIDKKVPFNRKIYVTAKDVINQDRLCKDDLFNIANAIYETVINQEDVYFSFCEVNHLNEVVNTWTILNIVDFTYSARMNVAYDGKTHATMIFTASSSPNSIAVNAKKEIDLFNATLANDQCPKTLRCFVIPKIEQGYDEELEEKATKLTTEPSVWGNFLNFFKTFKL